MRIEELKQKEVINTCNCKILGCADDIEFDICTGCIEAIIVPGPGKWCGLQDDLKDLQLTIKVDEKEVRNKIKV